MQEKQEKRGLFIPYKILTDNQLSNSEKIVLSYINSFDCCFMSQQRISDNLNMPIRTIKECIKKLIEKKYLKYDNAKNKYNRKSIKAINLKIEKVKLGDPQKTTLKNQVSIGVKKFNACDKKYSEKELEKHFINENELDSVEF